MHTAAGKPSGLHWLLARNTSSLLHELHREAHKMGDGFPQRKWAAVQCGTQSLFIAWPWRWHPVTSATLMEASHYVQPCSGEGMTHRPCVPGGRVTGATLEALCYTLPLVSLSTQSCAVGKQDYKAEKAASEQGVLALSFTASLSPSTTGSQPLSTCHTLLGKNRSVSLLFLFLFLGSTI